MRLGQAADGGERVERGDGGGDEERQTVADERGDAADGGAEREPRAERGAEQAEQAGTLLLGRDVGHRRLRDRHARATRAVDDAPEEQQPQRPGQPGQQAADRGAGQRQDDDRLAAEAVGQPTGDGREHDLRDRERGHQQPGHRRRRAGVARVAGEDREQDPEADEVERDGRPDDAEPRRQGPPLPLRPRAAHGGLAHAVRPPAVKSPARLAHVEHRARVRSPVPSGASSTT